MKILYLHQYFTTPDMAGGTRSFEMARRLVKRGHDVHIITSKREGGGSLRDGWLVTREAGIHVHWIPVPYSNKMSYIERIIAFAKFALASSTRAAKIESDVIFATSTPLTITLPAVYAAKKLNIPLVFEVRDLWPEIPIAVGALRNPFMIKMAQLLEELAYRNSNYVIALSPGMKEGVEATGYPPDRISIIPNSSDLDMFTVDANKGNELRTRYDWLQDRPLIIYTGAIGLINGVDYLAKLAKEASFIDKDVRFLVIGSGTEEKKVKGIARELGVLDNNFFIMPSMPKAQIPYWLSAANIASSFVIDIEALWMNSANKFFDALAAGKPIAINYGGWQADLLHETGAGLVLDNNDIGKAAKELIYAVRNSDWLLRAGCASRKLAEDRYDREKLALQLESVLTQAVVEGYRGQLRY